MTPEYYIITNAGGVTSPRDIYHSVPGFTIEWSTDDYFCYITVAGDRLEVDPYDVRWDASELLEEDVTVSQVYGVFDGTTYTFQLDLEDGRYPTVSGRVVNPEGGLTVTFSSFISELIRLNPQLTNFFTAIKEVSEGHWGSLDVTPVAEGPFSHTVLRPDLLSVDGTTFRAPDREVTNLRVFIGDIQDVSSSSGFWFNVDEMKMFYDGVEIGELDLSDPEDGTFYLRQNTGSGNFVSQLSLLSYNEDTNTYRFKHKTD